MKTLHTTADFAGWRLLAGWWLLLPAVALAAEPVPEQPAPGPPACQLILDGKHVEKLTLVDGHGQTVTFDAPDACVWLPPGRYRIQEIRVQWDSSSPPHTEADVGWLTVSASRPCHLDVGSPQVPRVIVTRRDKTLRLDYDFRGARAGARQPQFVIYQGDRKIASGSFEYG